MKTLLIYLWATLIVLVGVDQYQRWQKRQLAQPIFQNDSADNSLLFVDYKDLDFGFSMVVPQDWTLIVSDDSVADEEVLEPGYSVVFESPKQHEKDLYADYIMVEVLPGIDTGAFDSDGVHREVVIVDGQKAVRDKLVLVDFPFGETELDLSVHQAEIAQLGYTVGLYAIGTKDNARMLDEAFQALLYSFELPEQPYLITEVVDF